MILKHGAEIRAPYGLSAGAIGGGYVFASAMAYDWTTLSRRADAITITGETRASVERLLDTLAAAGIGQEDLVKITCWLSAEVHRDEAKIALADLLSDDAITTVFVVGGIGGSCNVELEAVARIPGAGEALGEQQSPVVFTSGMAIDVKTMRRVPEAETVAQETRIALSRVEARLADAGLTLRDITRTTCYLTDDSYRAEFMRAYREVFEPGPFPSRCTFVLGLAGDCRVQIEVAAAKPES